MTIVVKIYEVTIQRNISTSCFVPLLNNLKTKPIKIAAKSGNSQALNNAGQKLPQRLALNNTELFDPNLSTKELVGTEPNFSACTISNAATEPTMTYANTASLRHS